jgi:hypothetical protein
LIIMDLKPWLTFLKIVSFIGLIVFCVMMTAVCYKKLDEYYPDAVENHKWAFVAIAVLLSVTSIFIFQKFFWLNR